MSETFKRGNEDTIIQIGWIFDMRIFPKSSKRKKKHIPGLNVISTTKHAIKNKQIQI